jgi:hypothetical protein
MSRQRLQTSELVWGEAEEDLGDGVVDELRRRRHGGRDGVGKGRVMVPPATKAMFNV